MPRRRRQLNMPIPKRSRETIDDFGMSAETSRAIVEAFEKQCDLEYHADNPYALF
jgi:hypothetical protein